MGKVKLKDGKWTEEAYNDPDNWEYDNPPNSNQEVPQEEKELFEKMANEAGIT